MAYGTVNADLMTTSDGVSSSGLYGFKNRIINGAMVIDQRNAGASGTANGYTVDRWQYYGAVASKGTWQQNAGSVTPPTGFKNYWGFTSSSAYTVGASENFQVAQYIEGYNSADLGFGAAGASSVTLSFWVRSSLTGTFGGALINSAGNRSYPFSYTISSTNTWEQKSITIAGDTSGTWLTTNGVGIQVNFGLGVGSTYSGTAGSWSGNFYLSATGAVSVVGTNGATFYITGVQLEKGSTATSFDYRPYGTELALCQRYYQKVTNAYLGLTFNVASLNYGGLPLKVTMRAAPTLDSGASYSVASGNAGTPAFQNAGTYNSTTADVVQLYNSASNWTGSTHCAVSAGFNAEL